MTSGKSGLTRGAIAAIAVLALSGCGDGFRGLDAAIATVDAPAVDAAMIDAHVAPIDASALDASIADAARADASPVDASQPDASPPDAALPDASPPDAALPDAAPPDASQPDAAPPDASPPDARLPDASPPDARLPDASPPDARLPDASPPDAAAATIITVFATPSQYTGDLGGRTGADGICRANVGVLSCPSAIHALLSVDANDTVANMPTTVHVPANEAIQSPNGTSIATNWADLLDGNLQHSFGVAGLFDVNTSTDWWSGSNSDGTPSSDRCSDWTYDSAITTFKGEIGVSSAFNSTWSTAGASACNNTFSINSSMP